MYDKKKGRAYFVEEIGASWKMLDFSKSESDLQANQ